MLGSCSTWRALVLLNRRLHVVPAHTPHLVERVGLRYRHLVRAGQVPA